MSVELLTDVSFGFEINQSCRHLFQRENCCQKKVITKKRKSWKITRGKLLCIMHLWASKKTFFRSRGIPMHAFLNLQWSWTKLRANYGSKGWFHKSWNPGITMLKNCLALKIPFLTTTFLVICCSFRGFCCTLSLFQSQIEHWKHLNVLAICSTNFGIKLYGINPWFKITQRKVRKEHFLLMLNPSSPQKKLSCT